MAKSMSLCEFCEDEQGKYVCPKCECLYCSLSCYRSKQHEECSETFYKSEVLKEMSLQGINEVKQSEVLDLIKKYNEDDSCDSDDENSVSLQERLKNIDLNDEDSIWNCLTESEKIDFTQQVESGEIFRYLPEYKPWWENKIVDLDENSSYESKMKAVPKLSALFKGNPSPLLSFNLRNILTSYCFLMRLYQGRPVDLLPEACQIFFTVCEVLGENINCTDYNTAEERVFALALQCRSLKINKDFVASVKKDVENLLDKNTGISVKLNIYRALCDIDELLNKTNLSDVQNNDGGLKILSKKLLRAGMKKILFYMSWTFEKEPI